VAFAIAAEWVARLAEAHHAGRLQAELTKLGSYAGTGQHRQMVRVRQASGRGVREEPVITPLDASRLEPMPHPSADRADTSERRKRRTSWRTFQVCALARFDLLMSVVLVTRSYEQSRASLARPVSS
jgi:hypothetical protein